MMDIVARLPTRPLTAAEVDGIRSRSPVDQCIAIGAGTRDRRGDTDGVCEAVVLANGSLFALRLEAHGWAKRRLATDADRAAALDAALDLFYGSGSSAGFEEVETPE